MKRGMVAGWQLLIVLELLITSGAIMYMVVLGNAQLTQDFDASASELSILHHAFLYSTHGITYVDPSQRVHPEIIMLEKFTQEHMDSHVVKGLSPGEFFGSALTLHLIDSTTGFSTSTIYYHEEQFNDYKKAFGISQKGRGSIISNIGKHLVLVDNGDELIPAELIIESYTPK